MTAADWYMSHVWSVHRSRLTFPEMRAESWARGSGLLGSFTRWWGLGSWCAGPPFFFSTVCVRWNLPGSSASQTHAGMYCQPTGAWTSGVGGERETETFTVGEACCLWDSWRGTGQNWTLNSDKQQPEKRHYHFFLIVGIICGFNLNAPWLLKWLLLQVLNLYVKQRWEKFSHHVGYKTETSRTLTFTFRVCHQNTWIRVDELVFFQNIWLHSLFMYIVITSTNKVLFSVVSVCWFVSRITQKLLDVFSWHLDWGWVSAQNGAQ